MTSIAKDAAKLENEQFKKDAIQAALNPKPADGAKPADEQKPTIQKIRTGENLTKIAKTYGVSIKEIMDANDVGKGKAIVNQNLIIAGKEIKIPNKKEQVS